MKLLINSTTLVSKGVVQVAVSFIIECKQFDENEYMVLMSPMVSAQIDQALFPSNFSFSTVLINPNKLIKGYFCRKEIIAIAKKWEPDCVFSVFGPSYWTPFVPHLSGYAYPHYVYPESPFFNKISIFQRIKVKLFKAIHKYYFNKNGDFFVSETEDVSTRAIKHLGFKPQNVFTVSNTFNKYFNTFVPEKGQKLLPPKSLNEFRFLSLCSLAPHKNLEILNKVIPLLKKSELNVKFVITVDESQFRKSFNDTAKESIINVGRIDVSKCPQLYYETDALFLPTLLECYTANYPEALKMGKPILTSDLSFATSICQKAALYFDPLNANDISSKIRELVLSENIREQLIQEGRSLIEQIPDAESRAKQYLEICNKISKLKSSELNEKE